MGTPGPLGYGHSPFTRTPSPWSHHSPTAMQSSAHPPASVPVMAALDDLPPQKVPHPSVVASLANTRDAVEQFDGTNFPQWSKSLMMYATSFQCEEFLKYPLKLQPVPSEDDIPPGSSVGALQQAKTAVEHTNRRAREITNCLFRKIYSCVKKGSVGSQMLVSFEMTNPPCPFALVKHLEALANPQSSVTRMATLTKWLSLVWRSNESFDEFFFRLQENLESCRSAGIFLADDINCALLLKALPAKWKSFVNTMQLQPKLLFVPLLEEIRATAIAETVYDDMEKDKLDQPIAASATLHEPIAASATFRSKQRGGRHPYKPHSDRRKQDGRPITCDNCKSSTHTWAECWSRPGATAPRPQKRPRQPQHQHSTPSNRAATAAPNRAATATTADTGRIVTVTSPHSPSVEAALGPARDMDMDLGEFLNSNQDFPPVSIQTDAHVYSIHTKNNN